ncbi:MAG: RecQ family ATP-dependent DNA helicase [Actinobacteria bacterium]|nr:RecQ family ATP-dependent DNA helicase [Actinomycetota bacterium]
MPAAPSPVLATRAQELLAALAGPEARLRPAQLAAIEAVAGARGRALVVQRTGFGKSAIYFIATRLLRDAGAGPTLLVSPLLALMRDQVAAARRMGVRSATINSTNLDDWDAIEAAIGSGEVDLVCISPERLNNPGFVRRVLPGLASGLGLLVVDEAHCISDWGHDFRPDYRRIRDAIRALAPGTPVLATTATANARVCADVAEQLGQDVTVLRGPLDRESLVLGVARLPSLAHRLAWIATRVPELPGTGIVYCLTVAHTVQVAAYLQSRGIDATAYSSDTPADERERLEEAFRANRLKVLVATSALGMGVDKPDVAFVIHLGAPPSPVAYYQQVGRAGRSLARSEAWLLPGAEDRAIWGWFSAVGLPPEHLVRRVLAALGDEPASVADLERAVDLRRGRLEALLKILDVDGAARREGRGWVGTGATWTYDAPRVQRVEAARAAEASAMETYEAGDSCLMRFLRTQLDDRGAEDCGRCAVCTGTPDPVVLDAEVVGSAVAFLRGVDVPLDPRKQWARGLVEPRGNIGPARRAEEGRALCREGDAGWWPAVAAVFDAADAAQVAGAASAASAAGATHAAGGWLGADGELITGIVAMLKRWPWPQRPAWITWVPSRRREPLLRAVAERLAALGRLEVAPALVRVRDAPPQSSTQNGPHRLANVWGALAVDDSSLPSPDRLAAPVLLLDDVYDTGWTMTVAAARLRDAGVPAVLPLALARR